MSLLLCTLQQKTGSTGEDGERAKGILKKMSVREVCQTPLLLVECDEDFVRAE